MDWQYKGTPDIDYDYRAPDETYYSETVVVWAKWVNGGPEKPFSRFGHYVFHDKRRKVKDYWSLDGITGGIEVLCWAYITAYDERQVFMAKNGLGDRDMENDIQGPSLS
jgi:hypothetical protein